MKGGDDKPRQQRAVFYFSSRNSSREAARSNRPFRTVLEEVLQRGLGRAPQVAARRRVRIDSHPVGIKPALRAMSMNQLYDQIEADADGKKQ